jgi:hypothetical protein
MIFEPTIPVTAWSRTWGHGHFTVRPLWSAEMCSEFLKCAAIIRQHLSFRIRIHSFQNTCITVPSSGMWHRVVRYNYTNFQRNVVLSPSSGSKRGLSLLLLSWWFLLSLPFNHENGDSTFLRKVGVPYRTIRRHTPENNPTHSHRFESPKCNINVLGSLCSEKKLCEMLMWLAATGLFSWYRLLKPRGTDRLSFTAHLECTIEC